MSPSGRITDGHKTSTMRWMTATLYHEGWTRFRCKVIGFPPVLPPAAAALALPSAAAVVVVAGVMVAAAGFRRFESESSVDTSPSSRVLFEAPMMATPPAAAGIAAVLPAVPWGAA